MSMGWAADTVALIISFSVIIGLCFVGGCGGAIDGVTNPTPDITPPTSPVSPDEDEILGSGWIWYHLAEESSKKPTVVIVHGLADEARNDPDTWQGEMAEKILALLRADNAGRGDLLVDDMNIAFWDWGRIPWFLFRIAYGKAPDEGHRLALHIRELMRTGVIDSDLSRLHLIGHSYGGYVSAVCGKELSESGAAGKVGQLTGLDVPKAPILFDPLDPLDRIDIDDNAFGVITWYPILGPRLCEDIIIPSLMLVDNGEANIMTEPVRAEGICHTDLPKWYTDNKIVTGQWHSVVAVKRYRSAVMTLSESVVAEVSYDLESRGVAQWTPVYNDGFLMGWMPVLADEPATKSDTEHFSIQLDPFPATEIVQETFQETIESGVDLNFIGDGKATSLVEFVVTAGVMISAALTVNTDSPRVEGCYAVAEATVNISGNLVPEWAAESEQPTLFQIHFSGINGGSAYLQWPGNDVTLGGEDSRNRDCVVSLASGQRVTFDLEGELYESSDSGPVPGLGLILASNLLLVRVFSDEVLNSLTPAGGEGGNPARLITSGGVFPSGSERYLWVGPQFEGLQVEATVVWGGPRNPPFEPVTVGKTVYLKFVLRRPGLHVIRYTCGTEYNDTSVSVYVPVFVTGDIN